VQFNSIQFLLFFPVVTIAYFIIPQKWRWILLLGASYLFYLSWHPKYIVILLAVTVIGYLSGLWFSKDSRPATRRIFLTISLVAILGILLFFKFFATANRDFYTTLDQWGISHLVPDFNILLPLGISYFTLQTISYTIDTYRGTVKPEKHAGIYALFVAFFPHVTAGPIARANHLLPQFYKSHSPDYEQIVSGLLRMVWGFFKKLVIADRLAILVNAVYGDPAAYSGSALFLATYAFAFQIYCDFSGYADIAIGVARVMGFKLQENFQQPYYAQSILDFWRRWHITLYDWLRDYIFYPINRAIHRRGFKSTHILNIIIPTMVTMIASGFWHGIQWTFIIWGALHGMYLAASVLWNREKGRMRVPFTLAPTATNALKIFGTFNLVSFAWIFFRANSLSDAFYIIQHLFVNLEMGTSLVRAMPGVWYEGVIALVAILLMEFVHWLQRREGSPRNVIRRQPAWLRWSVYYGLVIIIFMFGKFESAEFIYAQF